MKFYLILVAVFISGCASSPKTSRLANSTSALCSNLLDTQTDKNTLGRLNLVTELSNEQCWKEVISLGTDLRQRSRDKIYNLLAETSELVVPDGTFTDYVLESYERAYLSYLIGQAYLQMGKPDDMHVELLRAYQEGQAELYNYGDDPVNLTLQAVLLENSGNTNEARPLWRRISELKASDTNLKKFATTRMKAIDSGIAGKKHWKVAPQGNFPQILWSMEFTKQKEGYLKIYSNGGFPETQVSEGSLLISTKPWAEKLSHRYDQEYHPLLHLKSWTRLPIGVGLGLATGTAGVGVGAGGCIAAGALASQGGNGNGVGELCEASFELGGYLIKSAEDVTKYSLQPDLRHWEKVPETFLITEIPSN